jgi:hypothetical protein
MARGRRRPVFLVPVRIVKRHVDSKATGSLHRARGTEPVRNRMCNHLSAFIDFDLILAQDDGIGT